MHIWHSLRNRNFPLIKNESNSYGRRFKRKLHELVPLELLYDCFGRSYSNRRISEIVSISSSNNIASTCQGCGGNTGIFEVFNLKQMSPLYKFRITRNKFQCFVKMLQHCSRSLL